MKNLLKTIVAFAVVVLLLTPAALALIWHKDEFVWTENGKKSLNIKAGESAEFTTGTFASADPVYMTVKLVGKDFVKVLLDNKKLSNDDSPFKYTIKQSDYEKFGEYQIMVILDDKFMNEYGESFAKVDSIYLNVLIDIKLPKNNAPVLEPLKGSYSAYETDQQISYKLTTSDKDGDKLTMEAQRYFVLSFLGQNIEVPLPLPKGFYYDTGKFGMFLTYDTVEHPDLEETYLLKFRAYDGKDYSQWQYTKLTIKDVDRAPVFTLLEDKQATEGVLLSFKVSAEDKDGDKLTYSAGQLRSPLLPKGMVLFKDTGVFLWTPDYTQAGEYTIVVYADDGFGKKAQGTFKITVSEKNVPPVLNNVHDFSVNEGETKSYQVSATDADNDPLTYQAAVCVTPFLNKGCLVSKPVSDFQGYTFNEQTGEFRASPDYDAVKHPEQEKSAKVMFRAYDGKQYSNWKMAKLTVIDVNRFPVALSDSASTLKDTPVNIKVLSNDYDADGDALEVTTVTSPQNGFAQILNGKEIKYTPDKDFLGTDSFDYIVKDGYGGKGTASVSVNVQGEIAVNHAPVLNPIGNKAVDEGQLLQFAVSATDADNDKLTFSAENLPQGAVFDANTHTFTWTPDFNQAEKYAVKFTVTDGKGGSDSITVGITVNDVVVPSNHPPVLDPIGNKIVKEGELLQFLVSATDSDNDFLTIAVKNLPNGAKFENNVFSWTPTFIQSGVYIVTFEVSDGKGGFDSGTIVITVEDVVQGITIVSTPITTATEGQLYTYQVKAVSANNNDLVYKLAAAPEGMTISKNGLVEWTPMNSGCGYKVIIAVSNGKVTAEQEYSICVAPAYKDLKFKSAQLVNEIVSAGEQVQLSVSVGNNGQYEMKDLRITAVLPDLGVEVSSDEFTLKSGKTTGRTLYLQMPYFVEPGQYLVKISASNSVYHDAVYRLVTVQ
ncbi:MAG: Ig-like domain-containing protein [Nanoarchaeota archaeon]